MVRLGNFFFRHRNWLFILFYGALFIPSPPIVSPGMAGERYFLWPIVAGLLITFSGQLIRALTIGLAYIIRGGREGKPYAEGLVTEGIFRHCRNPLYVGNLLMLLGVGVLANSLLYVAVVIPLFLFIYQAIVLAEEAFLRSKFGTSYEQYCKSVNRWIPNLRGIGRTLGSMQFNWDRWILKEHTTLFIWLCGIILILFLNHPQLSGFDPQKRNWSIGIGLGLLSALYLLVRYLKKSGKWVENRQQTAGGPH